MEQGAQWIATLSSLSFLAFLGGMGYFVKWMADEAFYYPKMIFHSREQLLREGARLFVVVLISILLALSLILPLESTSTSWVVISDCSLTFIPGISGECWFASNMWFLMLFLWRVLFTFQGIFYLTAVIGAFNVLAFFEISRVKPLSARKKSIIAALIISIVLGLTMGIVTIWWGIAGRPHNQFLQGLPVKGVQDLPIFALTVIPTGKWLFGGAVFALSLVNYVNLTVRNWKKVVIRLKETSDLCGTLNDYEGEFYLVGEDEKYLYVFFDDETESKILPIARTDIKCIMRKVKKRGHRCKGIARVKAKMFSWLKK